MRIFFYLLLTFAFVGLLIIPNASFATGLGIQIPSIASGTSNRTIDPEDGDTYDIEQDIGHFGFGFVLDTKVAKRGVFNYRLNINYEIVDLGDENAWKEDFKRLAIDNTFGFAVLQSKVVRLWIGPQVRLAYMSYSSDLEYASLDVNLIGLGLAPVFGANFNIGSLVSICPELGYRFSIYGGSMTFNEEYYKYEQEDVWAMSNREFFLRLNILFRISDNYDDFF
ncbi:MAG: hypothetical protein JW956_14320 [Calditrichaceae bacterium]|nr:hypothetical protein [Calditrichaceae bacterium]